MPVVVPAVVEVVGDVVWVEVGDVVLVVDWLVDGDVDLEVVRVDVIVVVGDVVLLDVGDVVCVLVPVVLRVVVPVVVCVWVFRGASSRLLVACVVAGALARAGVLVAW